MAALVPEAKIKDKRAKIRDPIEKIIADALTGAGIRFMYEPPNCLDFYLFDSETYIEVKQFHSDRIADQMSRDENVIAIQGRKAAEFFAACLEVKAND